MHPTDLAVLAPLPPIAKAAMEKIGISVDMQAMDWQTLVGRRNKREQAGGRRLARVHHVVELGRQREPADDAVPERRLREGAVRLALRRGDPGPAR